MADVRQVEPHGVHRGHPAIQENAEAVPSTQLPPTVSYGTRRRTTQPIGGTYGTVAYADTNKTITEEVAEEEGP